MARVRAGIGSMLLVSSALACVSPSEPDTRPPGCEKLDRRLFALTGAGDRAASARATGLYYAEGRVRTVVELVDAQAPAPAGVQVEVRADRRLQALVSVEELCSVAADPAVRRVGAPTDLTVAQ
jgi:hypothetical protein